MESVIEINPCDGLPHSCLISLSKSNYVPEPTGDDENDEHRHEPADDIENESCAHHIFQSNVPRSVHKRIRRCGNRKHECHRCGDCCSHRNGNWTVSYTHLTLPT